MHTKFTPGVEGVVNLFAVAHQRPKEARALDNPEGLVHLFTQTVKAVSAALWSISIYIMVERSL